MNTDSSKDTEHDSDHASRKPAGDSNDALIEPRRDYTTSSLSRADLDTDPVAQFRHWLADARAAKLVDATAMVLATVDEHSRPHSRVVLLKRADASGFAWYTFQDSDKGRQIAAQPYAALLFYWCALERQVRIEGRVERLDPSEADDYFYSRPEGSRFSAAASQQSAPVDSRAVLEARVAELHTRYPDGDVPRPEVWGGYRLVPDRYEFWQGRSDRLHDRFEYRETQATGKPGSWNITRMQP
jgi:pyridoxamine 5'-phosphate oxidase